jgi:hypothetical protein
MSVPAHRTARASQRSRARAGARNAEDIREWLLRLVDVGLVIEASTVSSEVIR